MCGAALLASAFLGTGAALLGVFPPLADGWGVLLAFALLSLAGAGMGLVDAPLPVCLSARGHPQPAGLDSRVSLFRSSLCQGLAF